MKKYIKKISNYSVVGGLGAVLVFGLVGCDNKSNENQGDDRAFTQASQKQGAFVVIEEVAPNQYQIVDEYPSSETRIILRKLDGSEKILSKEEIDELVAQESQKIDNGTSALTNPSMSGGGMGLGETLLASAAGAIIGSYIGNKLFNNQNYQNSRANSYRNRSTYTRSVSSFKKAKTSSRSSSHARRSSNKRSGFFSGRKSSSRSYYGG